MAKIMICAIPVSSIGSVNFCSGEYHSLARGEITLINEEAHVPHCSPVTEKQFQSINTFVQSYDYTKTLIKKKKYHYLLIEN